MTVFRVSFLFNGEDLETNDIKGMEEVVISSLLAPARGFARGKLKAIQADTSLGEEEKVAAMGQHLRSILVSLQAESNIAIEMMPKGTPVSTELPFERRYARAAND